MGGKRGGEERHQGVTTSRWERVEVEDDDRGPQRRAKSGASAKTVKDENTCTQGPAKFPLSDIGGEVLRLRGRASENERKDDYLNIFVKNARSLYSDERLEELIAEVQPPQWDADMINETWRAETEEYDTLESKHIWFGSGGTAGRHGVGILLHSRWTDYVRGWRAVSTRVGVLDLDTPNLGFSLIVVYMPHCGKSDACVEEVYATISSLMKEARAAKRLITVGGDWNAEVESSTCERDGTVGAYANASGNVRGDWLRRWATAERLSIANTILQKRWVRRWTHAQHGRNRIIDYIRIDRHLRQNLTDASASKYIDLGSDHRAVWIQLKFQKLRVRKQWQPKRPKSMVGWRAQEVDQYHCRLREKLGDIERSIRLDQTTELAEHKLSILEQQIRQSAEACNSAERWMKDKFALAAETQELIRRRRSLQSEELSRVELSKMI